MTAEPPRATPRPTQHATIAALIWQIADLLRGDFRPAEYGRVILPFLVLRRLDQVIAPTREAVYQAGLIYGPGTPRALQRRMLMRAAGGRVYNTKLITFDRLTDQTAHTATLIKEYVAAFNEEVIDVFAKFRFDAQVDRLARSKLLLLVVQGFAEIDLSPVRRDKHGEAMRDADGVVMGVSNHQMGLAFEELIRRFSEQSNETAGEHFTPREVIRLMVELLIAPEGDAFTKPGYRCSIYDPACGTGGMLSMAEEKLKRLNPDANPQLYGQELNGESYAICRADMLIKGQDADNIKYGNSFSEDQLPTDRFDYMLSNPPFGVEWSKAAKAINDEVRQLGIHSRFHAGLPRKNDGSLLFLLHMLHKMRRVEDGGARVAVVFNASPMFTGAAGSGESEIRRYVIENDWLEAIVALPDQMFYNTGINTYIWVLSNRKPAARAGKVVLVDGTARYVKMRKSLGDKRKELSRDDVATLARWYAHAEEIVDDQDEVVVVDGEAFGYRRITVERPLRLDFTLDDERLDRLAGERAWQKLAESGKRDPKARAAAEAEGRALQAQVLTVLEGMDRERVWMDRAVFVKDLGAAMKRAGVTLAAPLRRAIVSAVGERNPEAAVCRKKGQPEPDPELRDYENVPLLDDVDAYMAREVLPHVPDAWVDESRTKVGYEIPFSRYFYRYEPPRPVAEVEAELRVLFAESVRLFEELVG